MAEYETILRSLKGSPRGTAWFVDLLWRAGRVDRADQVWKSVRANKKVMSCDEGPLLEARAMLRRGELQPAEKVLNEAAPGSGVAQVERLLLLAWLAVALKQPQRVDALLTQAQKGPYPVSALVRWRKLLEWRVKGNGPVEQAELLSPLLGDLIRGQQARLAGKTEAAVAALRQARTVVAVEPFARYALAGLGQEDFAAILASQPGLFVALRCRVRQAVERFRTRQAPPPELLDALQQASSVQFRDPAAEHFQTLALLLQRREPQVEELRSAVSGAVPDPAQCRNLFRAAVEAMLRRLHPETQRALLVEWAQLPWLVNEPDAALRALLARPLLRLVLAQRLRDGPERATLEQLQPGAPFLQLLDGSARQTSTSSSLVLWEAARQLTATSLSEAGVAESWRQRVCGAGQGRWRGPGPGPAGAGSGPARRHSHGRRLARGRRGLGRLSPCAAAWPVADARHHRGSKSRSPRLETSLCPAGSRSGKGPPWVAEGKVLASLAGLTTASGSQAEPPVGMPVVPWFLHQAARAQGRGDAVERSPASAGPWQPTRTGTSWPGPSLSARPCRSWNAVLWLPPSRCAAGPANNAPATPAALLLDAVDLLRALPDGNELLGSLEPGLANLVERSDLPPRLVHHLALLQLRAAQWLEEHEHTDQAEPYWRRSWQLWLRWLVAPETAPEVSAETTAALLDFLLGLHRGRVNDLLGRNEVDRARRHWNLVQELPGLAGQLTSEHGGAKPGGPPSALASDLADRVARCRDELATEYLVTTARGHALRRHCRRHARRLRQGPDVPAPFAEPGSR